LERGGEARLLHNPGRRRLCRSVDAGAPVSLPDFLKSRGYPEFADGELIFPLHLSCTECRGKLVGSERVFQTCGHHRFRRGVVVPPGRHPDGRRP
jgi:hypothetical protein